MKVLMETLKFVSIWNLKVTWMGLDLLEMVLQLLIVMNLRLEIESTSDSVISNCSSGDSVSSCLTDTETLIMWTFFSSFFIHDFLIFKG